MSIGKEMYKVYDKKTKSYFTTGKKSTWSTKTGAFTAAKTEFGRTQARVHNSYMTIYPIGYLHENIEIHIYPLVNAIVVTYAQMETDIQLDITAAEKRKLKSQIEQKKVELNKLLTQIDKLEQLS